MVIGDGNKPSIRAALGLFLQILIRYAAVSHDQHGASVGNENEWVPIGKIPRNPYIQGIRGIFENSRIAPSLVHPNDQNVSSLERSIQIIVLLNFCNKAS